MSITITSRFQIMIKWHHKLVVIIYHLLDILLITSFVGLPKLLTSKWENRKLPAYGGQGMLPQPRAVQCSFHQYNAAEPECYYSPLEKLAMGAASQQFGDRDP